MRGKRLAAAVLLLLTLCACAQAASFDDDGLLRLVNREEKITKRYVPEGLVLPDVPTNKKDQAKSIYLRPEAAKALEEMFRAAREEKGYELLAVSGYRAFGLQQIMFNNKVEAVGSRERAWRTVAPAGASEHQLGLAMDILCSNYRNLNAVCQLPPLRLYRALSRRMGGCDGLRGGALAFPLSGPRPRGGGFLAGHAL